MALHTMVQPRSKALEVAARRKTVVALYLQGRYQWEIAEAVDVDRATVSRDLKAAQAEWCASSLRDFNADRQRELEKIDHLERTYWLAWERSTMDRETSSTEKTTLGGGNGQAEGNGTAPAEKLRASIRRQRVDGAAAFLSGVQWCINKRCAILGLDAPQRVSLNATDIDREIERLMADMGRAGEAAATAQPASARGGNAASEG